MVAGCGKGWIGAVGVGVVECAGGVGPRLMGVGRGGRCSIAGIAG